MWLKLVFALLRRLEPYRPPADNDPTLSLEELDERYGAWLKLSLIPTVLFTAALTGLWYLFFRLLQVVAHVPIPPSRYFLFPPAAFWLIPSFFLGLVCTVWPLQWLYRFLLGKRYAEFIHYTGMRDGFDGRKFFRWMALAIFLVAFGLLPFALDCYTRFTDESMFINPFWSFGEREYPYSEVAEVRAVAAFIAPNGNRVESPHFEIAFRDGYVWSTRQGLRDSDPEKDGVIVRFVSSKSGKPIIRRDPAGAP
jgi:hypothetical protein